MAAETLIALLTPQFFANNGQFLSGGTLASYQAGTNTPAVTYTDSTGMQANLNPIILNSRGECSCWVPANVAYKFILSDAQGGLIWSRDQVVNAQLITYYGVDTGAANAYILTAATPYTTYTNGELVFFVPTNTNTGASTININGLGAIPIVTITGLPVGAGQITAGIMTELIYFNGSFQLLSIGNTFGASVGTFGAEIPIASATTTDLGSTPNHNNLITGTTTINSFGSSALTIAPIYVMRFAAVLTLTFNPTSMILPSGASIVTAAGDSALFEYLGNGDWKCLFYQSTLGFSNTRIKPGDTSIANSTLTPDPDLITNILSIGRYNYELYLLFDSAAAGAGFKFIQDGSYSDSRSSDPALAYGFVNGAAYGPKSDPFYATLVSFTTLSTGANSNSVIYKGSTLVGTAGTFGISWAQASTNATPTTLRAGSYLTVTQLNTGSGMAPTVVLHTYTTTGSFTETVPFGFNNVLIEVWGAAGGSGAGNGQNPGPNLSGGGGGGSGAYCRSSYTVSGLGGETLLFSVATGGVGSLQGNGTAGSASGVTSGTMTITAISAGGGQGGIHAPNPSFGGAGGAGGTGTGGNIVNTPGAIGGPGFSNASGGTAAGGTGGAGIPGINNGGNAGGVGSIGPFSTGLPGGAGLICFQYS